MCIPYLMETLHAFNKEEHHGKPNGTTPVAVTSEHARSGVVGPITDAVCFSVDFHAVRVLCMVLRQAERRNHQVSIRQSNEENEAAYVLIP